ncbi:MAG TPA: DUF6438 domain-containing protein [Verrucomicrobiae bacterium]|nr:DUF6438 domain-containing protein [Verrucomicrobiae bacterium]
MRILALMIVLAMCQIASAGQIADFYWQHRNTNDLANGGGFSGPNVPATNHGITEIGIERTACFGTCPIYVCIIHSDGKVLYHGGAHVDRIGEWETTIDPYRFHHLANFIVESGFWQMQDTFAAGVTDGDTVYTTFLMKGQRKVFRNYANSGPSKLWALQQLVDGLLVGATWHPSVTGGKENK